MLRLKAATVAALVVGVWLMSHQARAQQALRPDSTIEISKAGMDPERLARITARMKEFVEKGTIPGAVMLVARHGVVATLEAVGYQDLETKKLMRTDTIFNIYSMTKPFTAVGIMTLLEEGRLTLSDPVEKHLPEFRDQVMVDQREGEKVVTTKKPSRPITIRDLLTHTSGMRGGGTISAIQRDKTLAENIAILAKELPLEFEPGTKYLYSNWGFVTLGRIIEVTSGKPYEEFIEQRLLRPLGMKDTFYFPPPEKCDRIASLYDVKDGTLTKNQIDRCRKRANYVSATAGWVSTASDLFAFYQMMLNGGTYNGVRILSRASVEAMTTLHTGDLPGLVVPGPWPTPPVPFLPGSGHGLGWSIVREPSAAAALALASIGSYTYGGHSGTFAWVDPKKDLLGIFLIQRHFGLKPGHGPERTTFIAMAAAAIVDAEKSKPKKNDAGMDSARLAGIPTRMKEFVEKGTIAGAVTLVARHGEVVLLEAVGYQDLETKKPMRTDTIFNIYSMTKPFTAVGIMTLLEEGRLTLNDPVEQHLPEFRDQVMVDQREGDKVVTTKKPSRPITIRDLLTHTSGMPGGGTTVIQRDKTAAENIAMFAKELALEFEPGTKYLYSNWGIITLGRVIEVVSGKPYEEFIEQRITRPLGMKDTFFFPPSEKCDRIASVYDVKDGTLTKDQIDRCRKRSNYVSTSGGWFSTAADLFAFYQMMLNRGTYNGVRILSGASVEAMTTLHTGDLPALLVPGPWPTPPVPTRPDFGYGLGWYIIHEPSVPPALALASIGSYGHGGHGGTFAWVDPKKDLVGIFLIQRHFGLKPGHGPERWTFMAMANAAIPD